MIRRVNLPDVALRRKRKQFVRRSFEARSSDEACKAGLLGEGILLILIHMGVNGRQSSHVEGRIKGEDSGSEKARHGVGCKLEGEGQI